MAYLQIFKKIDLLILTNSIGVGGAEKFSEQLYNAILEDKKLSIKILTLHSDLRKSSLPMPFKKMFVFIRFVFLLIKIIFLNVKIINSHMIQSNILARAVKIIRKDIKIIHTIHSNFELLNLNKNSFLSEKLVDKYIFVSKISFNKQKDFFDIKKGEIIPNAVQTNKFYFSKKDREYIRSTLVSDKVLVFLAVGRLVKTKGILELTKYWSYTNIKCELWILGDGPLREKIESSIISNNLSLRVKLINSATDIRSYYCGADYLISNSYDESFGLVFYEALLCGLPIIARKIPATTKLNSFGIKLFNELVDLKYLSHLDKKRVSKEKITAIKSTISFKNYLKKFYSILKE